MGNITMFKIFAQALQRQEWYQQALVMNKKVLSLLSTCNNNNCFQFFCLMLKLPKMNHFSARDPQIGNRKQKFYLIKARKQYNQMITNFNFKINLNTLESFLIPPPFPTQFYMGYLCRVYCWDEFKYLKLY